MTIQYTVAPCPLGYMLLAAGERGLQKLSLGDSEAALLEEFAAANADAERQRDDAALGKWRGAITAFLEGAQPLLGLPLDIAGSAFQRKVWRELRAIPAGETRSYSAIAAAIGQPTAARAVANACARNPAAILIPCHRAVRRDGSLGGYRWGIERKRALLAREREYQRSPR